MFPRYPTFRTKDFWAAAYLHLMGAHLLQTRVDAGRCTFEFDNAENTAYQLFTEFRTANGNDLVSIRAYRDAYRYIQTESRTAKVMSYDDETTRD